MFGGTSTTTVPSGSCPSFSPAILATRSVVTSCASVCRLTRSSPRPSGEYGLPCSGLTSTVAVALYGAGSTIAAPTPAPAPSTASRISSGTYRLSTDSS